MKDTNPGCSGQSRTHIHSTSKASVQKASCSVLERIKTSVLLPGGQHWLLLHVCTGHPTVVLLDHCVSLCLPCPLLSQKPWSPRTELLTCGHRLALLSHSESLFERVMSCRSLKHGIRLREAHKGRMPKRWTAWDANCLLDKWLLFKSQKRW